MKRCCRSNNRDRGSTGRKNINNGLMDFNSRVLPNSSSSQGLNSGASKTAGSITYIEYQDQAETRMPTLPKINYDYEAPIQQSQPTNPNRSYNSGSVGYKGGVGYNNGSTGYAGGNGMPKRMPSPGNPYAHLTQPQPAYVSAPHGNGYEF
jgi:hypothetical protein